MLNNSTADLLQMAQTFEDSHFKWTAQFDDVTLRDCDEIIGILDIHLRDNPRCMEIEALLFKAFLYVAQWRRAKNRNSKDATKCLELAFSKINKRQNDDARNGYSIVGYTLHWQIECNRQVESRTVEYARLISNIVKTPECNAFINATRAFALSLLGRGGKRSAESLKYYAEALLIYSDNTDWLFGYALVCGKKARIEGGEEALKLEETIYNKILQKDPNHLLAMVFLAQNKHYKRQEPDVYKLKTMFNKALALARRDDHGHTKVLTLVARFYRQIHDYKRALDILEEAERSIDEDPHEMLFRQKAMVYLTKYKKYDTLKRRTRESLLTGENLKDKYSLLRQALIHLTEAINRCDSGVSFRVDRAYAYEQLGMYEEASDEYSRLVDASKDYYIVERVTVYLRYGLYLNRRTEIGNVDIMMNYLSKGMELHVLKSDIRYHDNLIPSDVYWAMSFYDRINANRRLSATSTVRAEALYRLGWLRLLFSDATLENWQQSALSKNNPTRRTHLQLYEQAYDEIENHVNDNSAPVFVSDIIDGLIICHLKDGRKRNLSKAESLIQKLHYYNRNSASEKLSYLKLAQWEQSSESERPCLLSEAVQEGSLYACERLCEWFDIKTCPSSDPDVLRYCVQIQNCLSRDKLMYRQYKSLGGLFLHTLIDTSDMNNSEIDRKKSVLRSIYNIVKPKNDDLDELRELYLRWLKSRKANSGEADLIKHCSKVIVCARFALAHAVASFQRRFCSWYAPKHAKSQDSDNADSVEFRIVKAATYIKEKTLKKGGVTIIVTTLKEAVQKELRGMLEKAGLKQRPMPGFSLRFPDLFEYLTSIQPAANPDGSYDWIAEVNILTNKHKHEAPLSQMEYTVSVGKDDNGDMRRTFNIEDLAQTARFGVEKIVMEFRKVEKKFNKFDERVGLRFAEMKCLRINRYTAT